MDFELTAEQRRLRKEVVAFAQQELGRDAAEDDREGRFPWEDWRRCAEFGVLGWPVPKEYGGRGLDPLTTIVALEALGYGCRDNGLVFAVNNHLWGCVIHLLLHGTDEQKQRYLPSLCAGTLIGAQALSEPETGSDLLGLTTTARRDGDGYRLHGTKCFISNGPVADIYIVLGRTGDGGRAQNQLSAFLVTADMPGVVKKRELPKMGLRTTPMGVVEFAGTPVPAANLLGREGAGYSVFTSTIEWERSFTFASQVGAMERLLEASVRHANSRHQFGRSIGTFQAVSHPIADMKIRLELARMLLYKVGWLKREGRLALLEATMAKIFVSESLVRTATAAVEVHGARGYLTDEGIERELRDALGGPIYAGTNAVQRGILAELLGVQGALSSGGPR
ncbi:MULTISPECIES: acyl-CoA dehydrogenase family protein [unclassified Streptomyces]|uniref:acyl-CoA dehydrogenase family protein n=1 Tax=unclassified Streptomyces TaxID=2593676 RepID=UPI002365A19D|nr:MULTISPECIES: acyl-CoA dehydrogenase family protein [unclassified Streptomyces]MDF3142968.1 acyl-CoA dehydrogenase family protein [Streptomyces sp. T21Q-yed]WDF42880.1 acyl-CoA dehydrogenase family protein [Streptomyces sp. T12]